jgi:plasmid stabilization system protein ParE
MSRVQWSVRATAELEDLIAYLGDRSVVAARDAAAEIKRIAQMLGARSELGRPGRRSGSREFSMPRWNKVIIYRINERGIEISSLRDTRRLNPSDN